MHIPDGLLSPAVSALMFGIFGAFFVWSWIKGKGTYPKTLAPLLAVSSALIFVAQMVNFPIGFGTSGHLVGGTFLAMLLGPYATILSMTIVLSMQAMFFADGGIISFGANAFNMAVIGGLSFFLIKALTRGSKSSRWLLPSVFIVSWLSVVLGALATGVEIGFSPAFGSAGGVEVVVPAIVAWHAVIGLLEATITTAIISQLHRIQPMILAGLASLRGNRDEVLS